MTDGNFRSFPSCLPCGYARRGKGGWGWETENKTCGLWRLRSEFHAAPVQLGDAPDLGQSQTRATASALCGVERVEEMRSRFYGEPGTIILDDESSRS